MAYDAFHKTENETNWSRNVSEGKRDRLFGVG